MAGLTETLLLEARAKMPASAMQKFEQRIAKPSVMTVLSERAEQWIPNLAKIKASDKQTTAFTMLERQNPVLTTEKTITLGGTAAISKKIAKTFTYREVEFKISEKLCMENDWDFNFVLQNQFMQFEERLIEGIETLIIADLISQRSQINAISDTDLGSTATWVGATSYWATIAKALQDQFYGIVQGDMELNNYNGTLIDIHNSTWANQWLEFKKASAVQNVDLAWQDKLGFAGVGSTKLKVASGVASRHLIIPEGGANLIFWNQNDKLSSRARGRIADGWELYTVESNIMPGLFLEIASKQTMVDNSGLTAQNGSNQDIEYNFKIGAYFLLCGQPFSVSGESAIFEYRTLTT